MSKNGRNGPGWVYVIGEPGSPLVKIGTAADLDKRLYELGLSHDRNLVVFYAEHTMLRFNLEAMVHSRLSHFRADREWFRCSPALAALAIVNERRNRASRILDIQRADLGALSHEIVDLMLLKQFAENRAESAREALVEELRKVNEYERRLATLRRSRPRFRVLAGRAA